MTDAEILDRIDREFAPCPRPEHFTDYRHCCECYEHDELLRSRDRETLRVEDVGSEAWDPVCFATPDAFAYYMPALARLALAPPDPVWGWYGSQLAFHLAYDGPRNARWERCTPGQRRAVAALLAHVVESRAALADDSYSTDRLLQALDVWSDTGDDAA